LFPQVSKLFPQVSKLFPQVSKLFPQYKLSVADVTSVPP